MAWNSSQNKSIDQSQQKSALGPGAPVAFNPSMAGKPYKDSWDIERAYREGFQKVTWVNRCIDAIAGTDLANLQLQRDTYDPKNIVNGVKSAFSSKEDIEKETQTEVDNFKKETESSGRGQAMRDADAEGAKITAQFDADQKKKQAVLRNTL